MQGAIVTAFVQSRNFSEAIERFDVMRRTIEKLTDDELAQILKVHEGNDQLHNCGVRCVLATSLCPSCEIRLANFAYEGWQLRKVGAQ